MILTVSRERRFAKSAWIGQVGSFDLPRVHSGDGDIPLGACSTKSLGLVKGSVTLDMAENEAKMLSSYPPSVVLEKKEHITSFIWRFAST